MKFFALLFSFLALPALAQVSGPTTVTPRLTVGAGTRANENGDLQVNGDLTVVGDCNGCGAATPGADTQVIFNDGGTLAGDPGMTFNKTTNALTVGSCTGCSSGGVSAFHAHKTGSTSRNTTTTPTDDPDLILTSVPAGTYLFFAYVKTNASAGSGGGIRFRLAVTAGAIDPDTGNFYLDYGSSSSTATSGLGFASSQPPSTTITNPEPSTTTTRNMWWSGVVEISQSANVSMQWAQNSSVAVNTTLFAKSSLTLLKVN